MTDSDFRLFLLGKKICRQKIAHATGVAEEKNFPLVL
jgi:hypothetical protein